ncbi:MAG: SUMF1/EgtB/PvdO family nonheme iron enzyme, partial [Planctomycetes bacterium]|nr:SUMF1/EgtB/PvdO family nonheme iron enzyme [Planctomycetota bacterium]
SESLETCVRALEKAARGVAHAHRQGILHRDIKPGNIMLGEHGEVWVLDWGLVAAKGESLVDTHIEDETGPEALTRAGVTIGTPGYMAPEQAEAGKAHVGPPADVHGLGAVLYELLTEERPYGGQTSGEVIHQMSLGPPAPPDDTVPRPLAAIAMKALAQKPPNRYPSADAFADDLAAFLARQPISAYRAPIPVRAAAFVRRHVMASALAAVAFLGALGAAAVIGGRARLETAAASARENEKAREEKERHENAEKGLAAALARAQGAQARRLDALKIYAAPFEKVYTGDEQPAELIDRTFLAATDPEIARAEDGWQAAATEARIHLETLGAPRSQELDGQELDWAIEVALAHEAAIIESRWIERLRQNEAPFWKPVLELVEKGVTSERAEHVLAGTGRLLMGPIPPGCKAALFEIVTAQNPFGRREVELSEDLRLGSYDLVVTRTGETFHFPVLVERDRTKCLEIVLPGSVREGFVWIPPGEFLAGGDAQDAFPRHRRKLEKGFFLARTEVTFGEYIGFLQETPDRSGLLPVVDTNEGTKPVLSDGLSIAFPSVRIATPVLGVTRMAAERYLASRNARLPTEFEWERAAGGADGRVYAWGDEFDKEFANVQEEFPPANTGAHPRDESIFGVLDLAGSVSEWTSTDLPPNMAAIRGGYGVVGEDKARRAYRLTTLDPASPRDYVGCRAVADGQ